MNKEELFQYIRERFSAEPDYPWEDFDGYVFRHANNRKWFAVGMRVRYDRLGLAREGAAEVVDVKTGPLLMGSYLGRPGVLPGYHMNKGHWVTLLLDGTAEDADIRELLELSFDLTK